MKSVFTNMDISQQNNNDSFWLFPSNFLGAFAYWVTAQNQNDTIIIDEPVRAFKEYIKPFFPNPNIPTKFTYKEVSDIIDDSVFESIPEIMALNEMKPDFIDLCALARNVFYMIIREEVLSGNYDKASTDKVINS